MHLVDWSVLLASLLFIVGYGIYKTRKINTADAYLGGQRNLSWWMIGLSIMATQASAITFLSTPGQAYESGMSFVQFYFGLPLAMVILSIFFLPHFYNLKVYTAYEFLEQRFDLKTRTLTSFLFLVQRGLAAGLTIYAPAIILSTILKWDLNLTCIIIGVLVILYTVSGGTQAVSQTHKQQMFIIMGGMGVAFALLIYQMPEGIGFGESMRLATASGRMNIITTEFDLSNRYNIWTGFLGGTFLFLSYFGTDQSQVQRYLGGSSLNEGRMGLMFNALAKIPMQFFILLTGVLVFVFYQFTQSPLHFNPANVEHVIESEFKEDYQNIENAYNINFEEKKELALRIAREKQPAQADLEAYSQLLAADKTLRTEAKELIGRAHIESEMEGGRASTEDTDYVFISYVLGFFPIGIIGLLLAVIFSAAMSSTAAELNALATTSMVDIYKRHFKQEASDKHYLNSSKLMTVGWGLIALTFALVASLFENLIQAVNIIGSLFYGTILGVFIVAFFLKHVRGGAVFIAAVISEIIILVLYFTEFPLAYLWLNAVGCGLVMFFSLLIHPMLKKR